MSNDALKANCSTKIYDLNSSTVTVPVSPPMIIPSEETLCEEITWITLINYGYLDYAKNFLLSMKNLNISWKLKIFCIDYEKIKAELKDNPFCILEDASAFLPQKLQSDIKYWGDLEYKRIVFAKLDCIIYQMERQASGTYVGYIDTDIWLFKDPQLVFKEQIIIDGTNAILHACDESTIECSNKHSCPNICSGTIMLKNCVETRGLIKYTEHDVLNNLSDQHFLTKEVNNNKIKSLAISKSILLNGSWDNWCNRKDNIKIPDTATLIHANYMVGNVKKQKLKEQGWWAL